MFPRILYYTVADFESLPGYGHRQDHQLDGIFHGLRTMFGDNVIDLPEMEHMYKNNVDKLFSDKTKGFSLYGRLEPPIDFNPLDFNFDYVVVGLHHSKYYDQQFILQEMEKIGQKYHPSKVAIIDGNEIPNVYDLRKYGTIFKGELTQANADAGILPVSFCIPEENIVSERPNKDLAFAPLIPAYFNRGMPQIATYKYTEEKEYIGDYSRSYFAFTCGKGSFDCLRHTEILAAGCLPYFTDIENCPPNVIKNYPKDICKRIKGLKGVCLNNVDMDLAKNIPFKPWDIPMTGHTLTDEFDYDEYWNIWEEMMNYTRKHLTTKCVAKYIINTMENKNK